MSKTVAILQSSYIPWKGYFDIIAAVDEFVIFDEVQYTRRDWRNRNRIVMNGVPKWLTIPVANKGQYDASIKDMHIADRSWAGKHWTSLRHAYGKAPHFALYKAAFEAAYEKAAELDLLTEVNVLFLQTICEILELPARFTHSHDVPRRSTTATGRLVEICTGSHADAYVSGPAARDYIIRDEFSEAEVALYYADYSDYPTYSQGIEPFEHGVSILDTLFHCGPDARQQLKSVNPTKTFLQPG